MDGGNVSCLVATAFLEYPNLDLGITDYRHFVAYFGGTIKQSYCTKFPIDKTLGHYSAMAAKHYANCSNDHRFMDSQQMYTYKLAVEAWHRLLQLDASLIDRVLRPFRFQRLSNDPAAIVHCNPSACLSSHR